ncbi:methyl-accepting chemotaxis protein [Metabacillus endolithicus]|uniref:methyl-accepting chemotaxis protein n=1 Tax=Metabacillus endolithicus TaxID=1535204 RepID=UPI001FF9916E|nr:methyl-accepting chemotaxis protein [Metabacillus endolithicus]UPG65135.1 methyl-accepting chemotaxis protein [Metabacillus endolithicus]
MMKRIKGRIKRKSSSEKASKKKRKIGFKVPHFLNGMTLKSRIIMFLLLFTIIPSLIIGNVVYFVSKNTIEDKVSTMNEDISAQVTKNVNNSLKEIENLTLVPFSNLELMEKLESVKGLTDYEKFLLHKDAVVFFLSITSTNNMAKAMFFINEENTIFGDEGHAKDLNIESINSNLSEEIQNLSRGVLWKSGIDGNYEQVYLFRKYNRDGRLILAADGKLFEKVFESGIDVSSREITIYNEDGMVISSNNEELIGTKFEDHKNTQDNLVSIKETENGWNVAVSTSKSYLMKEIQNVLYLVYIIIFAFVLLSVFVSIFLARSMIKPIHRIVEIMKEAEKGDLTHRADYLYKNEVGQLGTSFNNMIDNITIMIEENKKVSAYAVNRSNDLKRIASESASATEQIATAIDEVARGAVSQVDYSEKTNREMKELSSEINEVAGNMVKVSSITETTKKLSSQSIETIKELTKKSEEMGTNIGQVDTTMDKLNVEINFRLRIL